ncbi:uncharacterized protein LOC123557864 isoform X2 [Mercenaria mercenaria]|uniref:uncharacterized protein LOC123557864 isoform X2 n=1 Tax=Mercenaria mercenaria TaxID=6596 RepID=UPI00234E7681|nr:uncharacterized protein LOC123557864 isoform X2 [Mercenaria mercenaria]
MPDCTPVSSHTQDTALITKDNVYDLLPSTYSLTPGTQVTVSCVAGLRLVGPSTFSCNNNGQWSYSSKPYCTDEPEKQETSDDALDETSKIIIGVVCGIAALIVIALVTMIVVIMLRDRRRRRERREFWESIREERQGPEFRGVDGPSTIDVEMYTRYPHPMQPPPYDYGYKSAHDRDLDLGSRPSNPMYSPTPDYDRPRDNRRKGRKSRSFDDLSETGKKPYPRDRDVDRGSRLSNPMYLPTHERPDYDRYYDNRKKGRNSRSNDDLTDRKPYVREWVSRNSMVGSDEYLSNRPGVHGSRHGRDPYLWRNANY